MRPTRTMLPVEGSLRAGGGARGNAHMFRDRADAAARLARRLDHLRAQRPLVLAVPRGGVPIGRIVADALGGQLDLVLVHKLGAPENPEFAVGAVGEDGDVLLNDGGGGNRVPSEYIEREAEAQLDMLRRRRRRYSPVCPPLDPAGRTAIVVDDGAATGSTLLAGLRLVAAKRPARLVVALGVAPADTVARLGEIADEVICLEVPRLFFALGRYYRRFDPVSDDEVVAALGAHGEPQA